MSQQSNIFARWAGFIYGVICYIMFYFSLGYFIFFSGDLWVPKTINSGIEKPFGEALTINLLLVALFGVQHSVMARQSFKRWWTRIVPASLERSTFLLATNICLAIFCWLWVPMTGDIWLVENLMARKAIWVLFAFGWILVAVVSFLIDHFELFGLQQIWALLRGTVPREHEFKIPTLYKIVRHPMQFGVVLGLFAVPHMTVGHLVLSLGMTLYILIGISFEERDLVANFGDNYREYRRRVPMLIPGAKLFSGQ